MFVDFLQCTTRHMQMRAFEVLHHPDKIPTTSSYPAIQMCTWKLSRNKSLLPSHLYPLLFLFSHQTMWFPSAIWSISKTWIILMYPLSVPWFSRACSRALCSAESKAFLKPTKNRHREILYSLHHLISHFATKRCFKMWEPFFENSLLSSWIFIEGSTRPGIHYL